MSSFGVHGSPALRTYVSNTGEILPAGGLITDLGVQQVGFFKVDKQGIGIPDKSLSAPTVRTAPVFKFGIGTDSFAAQSAIQPKVSLFPFLTQEIKGRDIIGWRATKANNEPSTEIYTVGYDGVDANKTLKGVLDYKELVFQLRLWGNPIYKLKGNDQRLVRNYYISKGCIDKCLDVCDTNPGLASDLIADDLIKQVKNDKFHLVPISDFVKVSKLRKTATGNPTISGLIESTRYTISICDDGSGTSLGSLQAQYPGFLVKLASRQGSTSTYEMWRLTSQGAPASFVNTASVALAVCDTCPSGYTLVPSAYVTIVERPITPTTDVSTPAAQQTYANTIGAAYAADSRKVNALTGIAGTGYANGTFPLTFTGGGFTRVATGTVTVVGGAITARTITDGGAGYTSAPTVTATGLTGGTGGTLVATISAAPTTTNTYAGNNNGVATILVSSTVPFNSNLLGDNIISQDTAASYCTPPTGSSLAWTVGTTRNVAPKQYMITLGDSICGTSRLAELQAAYSQYVVAEASVGTCARVYTITTYSDPSEPDVCALVDYIYNDPENFLRNASWTDYVAPAVNPDCDVEEPTTECVAAGVKFETAAFIFDTKDCVYGYYDWNIGDVDPVYMEISVHTQDWTAPVCYYTDQFVTKLRGTAFVTGQGNYIKKQERSTLQYEGKVFTHNPAFNDAYGINFVTKDYLFYDTYHLTVENNKNQHGITGKSGKSNQTTYTFAFPSGTGKKFEALMNNYIISLDNEDLLPVIL